VAIDVAEQSTDYCLECAEKHLQTAKVLLREAIQRYEACYKNTECVPCCSENSAVLEKVRGAVAELAGCEDDTSTNLNEPRIREINRRAREIRKEMWNKKLAFGEGTLEDLKETHGKIEQLANYVYEQPEISEKYESIINQIVAETPMPEAEAEEREEEQEEEHKPKLRRKSADQIKDEVEHAYRISLLADLLESYSPEYSPEE